MTPKERYTYFPEGLKGMTALDLYRQVFPQIAHPRQEVYISRPVTSGIVAEWFSRQDLANGQKMAYILEINRLMAQTIVQELEPLFPGEQLTLPPFFEIGELEAITFWAYYLSGLEISAAEEFNRGLGPVKQEERINIQIFNTLHSDNKTGWLEPWKRRRLEYFKLLGVFTALLSMVPENQRNPVSCLVLLPGHQHSFGCTSERILAGNLKIPIKEAVFDENHPHYAENLLHRLLGPMGPASGGEEIWQRIKDYPFKLPTVRGQGTSLVILRDYQG